MLNKLKNLLLNNQETPELITIHVGRVAADAVRCVQCGTCGYNCPVGINVREYARQGLPVTDSTCITCGNCIQVCPRGTLRWEQVTNDQ